jgi:tetratricopeptide (TPR) repeat protein
MDRLTRHELKQDDFRVGIDQLEQYLKTNLKQLVTVAVLVVGVAGLTIGLKYYISQQEASANAELASALTTFHAYVGQMSPNITDAETASFPTAATKYQKALGQFNGVVLKYRMYPRPKAAVIALYYVGICESLLGNSEAAIRSLQQASGEGDQGIAALARFALAGEFLKSGKTQEAAQIYQSLADHPSLTVPRASALLAMADTLRVTQPGQARQLYSRIEKEFGSDASIADTIKQQMAGLPQ